MLAASCYASSACWKQLANHFLFVAFPVPSLVPARAEHQANALWLEQLGEVCSLSANPFLCTVTQEVCCRCKNMPFEAVQAR